MTIRPLSKKRASERLASEGRKAWSTIAPTPRKKQKPRKAIRKVNPERETKRRTRYAQKLAAYRRSETFKLVEARAGGQCERQTRYATDYRDSCGYPRHDVQFVRCHRRREDDAKLTHHHKTYARFGGNELPTDIILLCDWHNDEAESQHPTRKRNYR